MSVENDAGMVSHELAAEVRRLLVENARLREALSRIGYPGGEGGFLASRSRAATIAREALER